MRLPYKYIDIYEWEKMETSLAHECKSPHGSLLSNVLNLLNLPSVSAFARPHYTYHSLLIYHLSDTCSWVINRSFLTTAEALFYECREASAPTVPSSHPIGILETTSLTGDNIN